MMGKRATGTCAKCGAVVSLAENVKRKFKYPYNCYIGRILCSTCFNEVGDYALPIKETADQEQRLSNLGKEISLASVLYIFAPYFLFAATALLVGLNGYTVYLAQNALSAYKDPIFEAARNNALITFLGYVFLFVFLWSFWYYVDKQLLKNKTDLILARLRIEEQLKEIPPSA